MNTFEVRWRGQVESHHSVYYKYLELPRPDMRSIERETGRFLLDS
jgi:hypothetical protein